MKLNEEKIEEKTAKIIEHVVNHPLTKLQNLKNQTSIQEEQPYSSQYSVVKEKIKVIDYKEEKKRDKSQRNKSKKTNRPVKEVKVTKEEKKMQEIQQIYKELAEQLPSNKQESSRRVSKQKKPEQKKSEPKSFAQNLKDLLQSQNLETLKQQIPKNPVRQNNYVPTPPLNTQSLFTRHYKLSGQVKAQELVQQLRNSSQTTSSFLPVLTASSSRQEPKPQQLLFPIKHQNLITDHDLPLIDILENLDCKSQDKLPQIDRNAIGPYDLMSKRIQSQQEIFRRSSSNTLNPLDEPQIDISHDTLVRTMLLDNLQARKTVNKIENSNKMTRNSSLARISYEKGQSIKSITEKAKEMI